MFESERESAMNDCASSSAKLRHFVRKVSMPCLLAFAVSIICLALDTARAVDDDVKVVPNENRPAPTSLTADKYNIAMKDGTIVVGFIEIKGVKFNASYAVVDLNLADIVTFSDGFLTLADGSKLKGSFPAGNLAVKSTTTRGEVNLPFESIASITKPSAGVAPAPNAPSPAIASTGNEAKLSGKVIDCFGKPLPGVSVAVLNSRFATITDNDGNYSLGYVPGTIKVSYQKAGYYQTSLDLQIATAATYPVRDLQVFKVLPGKGVFFVGKNEYTAVAQCKVDAQTVENKGGGNLLNPERESAQNIYSVKGQPTRIQNTQELTFLDSDGNHKSLCRVSPNRAFYKRRMFGIGLEFKHEYELIQETGAQIAEGVFRRKMSVSAGDYVFVSHTYATLAESLQMSVGGTIGEPSYLFQVGNDTSSGGMGSVAGNADPSVPGTAVQSDSEKDPARREILDLIEKAITAAGGREVLNRFKVAKTVATATCVAKGKNYILRTTTIVELPDKLGFDQEITYSGKKPVRDTFWVIGDQVVTGARPGLTLFQRKATKAGEAALRRMLYFMECKSLLPLFGADYQLEKISSPPQESCSAVKVRKAGKPDVTLLFDTGSGFLVGMDCNEQAEDGKTIQIRSRLSDFRNFSGLMTATKEDYSEGSDSTSISKVELVAPLDSFPDTATGNDNQAQLSGQRREASKERGGESSGIVVSISGGTIEFGKDTFRTYQPVKFELTSGEQKEITFRREDKPNLFVTIPVMLDKDGKTFYFYIGMHQKEIRDEGWNVGRTYFLKETKYPGVFPATQGIQISIQTKH